MSIVKREMEEQEHWYNVGLDFCVRSGAIEQCEYHEGIFYEGSEDVEAAYRLANAEVSSGKFNLGSKSRRNLTDSIKSAYDDNRAGTSCAQCDNNFEKD